jgi:tol-pal system protein YbgF
VSKGRNPFLSFSTAVVAVVLVAALPGHAQIFGGGDEVARKQLADQSRRIEDLRQQVTRLEESLKSVSATNPALGLADQLEGLRREMMQLRGQLEVLGNDIQMASKRQRDMYVDLDSRMKRLEQPPAAEAAPAAAQPSAAAPATAAAAAAPAAATTGASAKPVQPAVATTTRPAQAAAPQATEAETRAYEAAQGQRRIGNYQGAIAAFRNFIAENPKSSLAHRAQYWIGDSYYNLREFKSAIQSQQKLIASYPDSTSVPDALLNIASCQIELGDTAAARKTLDRLIARYPASDAAEKGRRRLTSTTSR